MTLQYRCYNLEYKYSRFEIYIFAAYQSQQAAVPAHFPKNGRLNSGGTPPGTVEWQPALEGVGYSLRCQNHFHFAMVDTYPSTQLLMNWGVYLTLPDQGGVQGGQGMYTDPWSSPVSTINTVNTKLFGHSLAQDWSTINSAVSTNFNLYL